MIRTVVRRESDFIIARIESVTRDKISKANIRALNRAIDTAQTVANRKIRERYNVKAAAIRKAFKKKRASKRQAYAVAELEISGIRIPLIEFSASWSRKMRPGASVRVLREGGRKRIPGAFIGVHGASGARQVFIRTTKDRYPIKALRSVSVPQQFTHRAVLKAVQEATREAYSKNFAQQLKYLSGA